MLQKFILDILFPCFCLNCGQEGSYLCQDCKSCLEVLEHQYCLCKKPHTTIEGKCAKCHHKKLDCLYYAVSLENKICQKLIQQFKQQPFIKELAKSLTSLIIAHFFLSSKKPDFSDFVLIAIPQEAKEIKRRGYNQALEIAKELKKFLELPLMLQVLEKNNKGFYCKKAVENKKILLINDVYATGDTMEKCASILKNAGAEQVRGIAIARGLSLTTLNTGQ